MRKLRIDELATFLKYVVDACESPYNRIRHDLMANLFENLISNGSGTVYGETVGGEPAGFIAVIWTRDPITGDDLAIQQLWLVSPEYRSGPIAGSLFAAMEKEAEQRGCKRILSGCILDRERLGAQYRRHGFTLYSETYEKVL